MTTRRRIYRNRQQAFTKRQSALFEKHLALETRRNAISQIHTLKAQISCIESHIIEIALRNDFDPYVFIKHDFSGDAVAIDDMVIVIEEEMAKIDRKKLKDHYIDKLADVCLKSRFHGINDKAFVLKVRALTSAFHATLKEGGDQ